MKTLIIGDGEIKKIVGIKDAIKVVEGSFRKFGEGKVQMPAKLYINLDKFKGDFRAMPAHIEGLTGCGIKWVNVHPENKRKGLPTVMALIILGDVKTGYPLCVMGGTYITALRTGAAGGIAAKHLARKDSENVALVGCGAQAETQLLALNELFKLKRVNVAGSNIRQAEKFIRKMEPLKIKMHAAKNIKECVKDADIVVTTTPVRKPIVKFEWLKEGAHISAIGADAKGKQELDPKILKKARIVVDAIEQAAHSGEINVPLKKKMISVKDIYGNIGEIAARKKKGRRNSKEITVFDSTGLAIQDVSLANAVYKKALKSRTAKKYQINLIG